MNSPNDDKYWTDGSYVQTNQSDPKATKVSYASDDHSAIISTPSAYFISKWGALCLMKHTAADCPYNSSNLKYYKLSMEMSGDEIVALPNNTSTVSRQYTLSNVPAGATVQWTVVGRGTLVSGQGSNTIQTSITGSGITTISAKVNCPTGLVVRIPFGLNVISSSAPIVTDITLTRYGVTNLLEVKTNQPDGNFIWSVTGEGNATFYDNPYAEDASFAQTPNVFKAIEVSQSGYYTISIKGHTTDWTDEYNFSKELYINK